MKKTSTLLYLLLLSLASFAQESKKNIFDRKLYAYEDTLRTLGNMIVNSEGELERRNATFAFIRTLVKALKLPNSFEFPFDSVVHISQLRPKDNSFRLFNWHLRNDDGTYRYYGAIQKNNPEKLELYPLFDNSEKIINPEDTILQPTHWYGAHYYKLLERKHKRTRYYTLLGWKGNDTLSQKKVIEVLLFPKETGKPQFGAPVFKMQEGKMKNRIVFEYTTNANMMLRYLDKKKWIVYDHLAPSSPSATGYYPAYGPDLSYDGLKFKKGKWTLMEDLDLRNEKSPMDKFKPEQKKETLFEEDLKKE